jgi:small glutamine-rich tetratricopeptide repeat-containing protein alpha
MADAGHLVFAILKFLDDQQRSPDLTPDAIESLEVATQCLESAYGLSIRDVDAEQRFPMPAPLPMIFAAGLAHLTKVPEASVVDREVAENLKTEGNELMKQEKYTAAIDCYTKAIETDGRNAVYYCNRAAAYGKLGEHQKSLDDCHRALELDPKYGKAFGRMGLANAAMGRHAEARQCYQTALALDPENVTYRENLKHSEQCLRDEGVAGAMPGGMSGGLNMGGLGGLDLTSLLSNPALMNMATSMLSNPQMQQMMASMMAGASGAGGPAAPGAAPGVSSLLQAGQQLAQQMQQSNPELVEQLRSQMRTQGSSDDADAPQDGQSPPDDQPMGDS